MPLRHQNTKTHKEKTISILYLVSSLSLRLPRKEVYPVKLLALCNPRSCATQLHRAGNI